MSRLGIAAGVIDDARRRRRLRRGLAFGAAAATAVAVHLVLGAVDSDGGGTRLAPAPSAPRVVAPAALLAGAPGLGVACRVPNSVACDRIGVAVWLRRPALSVSATVASRPVALNDPHWSGPRRHGRRTMFAGFVTPVGIVSDLHLRPDAGPVRWLGSNAPTLAVVVRVDFGGGDVELTHTSAMLSAGWG